MQLDFGFAPRKKILISTFREILEKENVFRPVPSEEWFYMLIESGEIEARKIGGRYFIFEDSAIVWLKALDQCAAELRLR